MNNGEDYEMYRKGYLQGYESCKREFRHRLNLFNLDMVDLELFCRTTNDMKGSEEE